MAYVPPHLRKATKKATRQEIRQEFRQEFPQLAPPVVTQPVLSFSHIAHLVEPLPPKEAPSLPHGWVNLKYPDTYIHPQPSLDLLAQKTILRMIDRWTAWDWAHEIYDVTYECDDEFNDDDDYTESETSSTTAEDAEYFSDES